MILGMMSETLALQRLHWQPSHIILYTVLFKGIGTTRPCFFAKHCVCDQIIFNPTEQTFHLLKRRLDISWKKLLQQFVEFIGLTGLTQILCNQILSAIYFKVVCFNIFAWQKLGCMFQVIYQKRHAKPLISHFIFICSAQTQKSTVNSKIRIGLAVPILSEGIVGHIFVVTPQ